MGAGRCSGRRLVLRGGPVLRRDQSRAGRVDRAWTGASCSSRPFPYSALRGLKRRPVCVVSSSAYSQGPDVIVAMVTSNQTRVAQPGSGDVALRTGSTPALWPIAGPGQTFGATCPSLPPTAALGMTRRRLTSMGYGVTNGPPHHVALAGSPRGFIRADQPYQRTTNGGPSGLNRRIIAPRRNMRGLPTLVRRLPGALVLSAAVAVVVAAMMGSGVDRPALQPAASGGAGYWLVTSEGAVSAFGDAVAAGSLASAPARPVRGMAPTPSGNGYWLVASDGGSSPSVTPGSSARRAPSR